MTPADELGMAWWNALTEQDRRKWSRLGTGVAKDAWELFKLRDKPPPFMPHQNCNCLMCLAERG